MADSQGTGIKEASESTEKKDDTCLEYETSLLDYFMVLWKRKTFIFLATFLPTVCAAAILWLLPRNYTVTYVYDVKNDSKVDTGNWEINKKNYDILLNRFYGEENSARLIGKLQKDGFKEYADQLGKGTQMEENIKLEAIPRFLDISKLNITDAEKLDKILDMKASLFYVTILHHKKDEISQVAAIIRDNIEQAIPLYLIQEQLFESLKEFNSQLASIDRNRFTLELSKKNINEVLAGLKLITVEDANNTQGDVTLQFDIAGQNQYLPLSYQIQAAESKKIELEETIKITQEKYNYYIDLVDLNTRVLTEIDTLLSSDYTTQQLKSFLVGLSASSEKPQLKDYLNSYIWAIENTLSANRPVTEKPKIIPVARKSANKTAIVLAACLMLAVLAAFLKEGFEKNKSRHS